MIRASKARLDLQDPWAFRDPLDCRDLKDLTGPSHRKELGETLDQRDHLARKAVTGFPALEGNPELQGVDRRATEVRPESKGFQVSRALLVSPDKKVLPETKAPQDLTVCQERPAREASPDKKDQRVTGVIMAALVLKAMQVKQGCVAWQARLDFEGP